MRDEQIFAVLAGVYQIADPLGAIMLEAEQAGQSDDLAPEVSTKSAELTEAIRQVFVVANELLLMTRGPLQ